MGWEFEGGGCKCISKCVGYAYAGADSYGGRKVCGFHKEGVERGRGRGLDEQI